MNSQVSGLLQLSKVSIHSPDDKHRYLAIRTRTQFCLEKCAMNLIVTIPTGSRTYGTYRLDSDYDSVTILMPTRKQLLGLEPCNRIGGDRSVYYLHDFIHLQMKGAVNLFELFFMDYYAGPEAIWWVELPRIRDVFATKKLAGATRGFIFNHLRGLEKNWSGKKYAHILRVIDQLNEYEQSKVITFPRPNAASLKKMLQARTETDLIRQSYKSQTGGFQKSRA